MSNVTKSHSYAELSSEATALSSGVSQALDDNDYERLAQLLNEACRDNPQLREAIPSGVLDALRFICAAGGRCLAEASWHRQAEAEALRREYELRQQLQEILEQLASRRPRTSEPMADAPIMSASVRERCEDADHTEVADPRPRLWQRLTAGLATHREERTTRPPLPPLASSTASPSIAVYCLGRLRIFSGEQELKDWANGKGKSVFKYLITHRERPVAKEVLMEAFWPDSEPCHARNNLNVAIYHVRQALAKISSPFSYVLFQDNGYWLNPELGVWADFEAFRTRVATADNLERRGDHAGALREYRAAEVLYQGELLEEDRYESWLVPLRQSLQDDYMRLLDRVSRDYFERADFGSCTELCNKMLAVDGCCEKAHRQLMLCYKEQGHRYLALRQFHVCVEALHRDLELEPSEATVALYRQIRNGQAVS